MNRFTPDPQAVFAQLCAAMCRKPADLRVMVEQARYEWLFTITPHPMDFGVLLGKREDPDPATGRPRKDAAGRDVKGGKMFNALKCFANCLAVRQGADSAMLVLNNPENWARLTPPPFQQNPGWVADALELTMLTTAAAVIDGPLSVTWEYIGNDTTRATLFCPGQVGQELEIALGRIYNCMGSAQGMKIALLIASSNPVNVK